MSRNLSLLCLLSALVVLATVVSGCGPDDTEVTLPMVMTDTRISEIRSTGVTVIWRTNLAATAQVDWFSVPISAFQAGLSLQDLLKQPGVTISNSAIFDQEMSTLHECRVDGLTPGGWYALRLSCSNQQGARASALGWNLVFNTFSTSAGPPESMGIVPSGERESVSIGDGALVPELF